MEQSSFHSFVSTSGISSTYWRYLLHRITQVLQHTWKGVQSILCNDAPEGYLPEDLEEEAEEGLDTKTVLSYSWRALKEARYVREILFCGLADLGSLLTRTLVTRCPTESVHDASIPEHYIQVLGDLCFTQLVELRHRGAFTTVAQTFLACCDKCAKGPRSLRLAVEIWYQVRLTRCREFGVTMLTGRHRKLWCAFETARPSTLAGLQVCLLSWLAYLQLRVLT